MVQKECVKAQLFDTSGNRRFRRIMESYFKVRMGTLLFQQKESFDFLKYQLEDFMRLGIRNRPILVFGNKYDQYAKIEQDNRVDSNLAQKFCKENNLLFFWGNAKNSKYIDEAIRCLTSELISRTNAHQMDTGKQSNFNNSDITQTQQSNKMVTSKESQSQFQQNQDVNGNLKKENDILKAENQNLKEEIQALKSNFKQVFEIFEKEVLRLKLVIQETEEKQKK